MNSESVNSRPRRIARESLKEESHFFMAFSHFILIKEESNTRRGVVVSKGKTPPVPVCDSRWELLPLYLNL